MTKNKTISTTIDNRDIKTCDKWVCGDVLIGKVGIQMRGGER